jgi:mercuric ion binding protein
MKNSIIIIISALLLSFGAFAQDGDSKFSTIDIKTSAVCHMCIKTIEKGFAFEKGVKSSKVDLDANTVTVTYRNNKTDAETLKKALTHMGYSADEMAPNPKAYDNLHYCCKADHDHGDH